MKAKLDNKVATLTTPKGGVAARCQAVNRQGKQCGKPARTGFQVCGTHGSGYKKREEAGERQPAGRTPAHGLYAHTPLRHLQELREEVASLELDLNDTDQEMVTLKSIVWHLLNQAERMNRKADMLEAAVDAVERTLEVANIVRDGEEGELTPEQARQVAAGLAAGNKLLSGIAAWTDRLLDANLKVITAVKARAGVRARLAEEQAVQHFSELAAQITRIIWSMAPDDSFVDAYEARLRRELFGPLKLELPDATEA